MGVELADWDMKYLMNDAPWERKDLHPSLCHWIGQDRLIGNIIIPGCGRSLEPLFFARKGLAVTMVDISQSAIEAQKLIFENYDLYAEFVQQDILDWQPDIPADIVYEQTCLCALHPKLREQYASQVETWLVKNGIFLANFMQTGRLGGPPYDCSIEDMKRLFPRDKWNWSKTEPLPAPLENGMYELSYLLIKK